MPKTAAYLFIAELILVSGFILYLLLFKGYSAHNVWSEWGIPLIIFVIAFTTYPFFRAFLSGRKG